jgi:glycosyltransferase involved in cell wall biosynthesis
MHVGYALLTLFPGRVGGSETYVRGLLGAFADGHGPERVTVLANRHVLPAYRDFGRGPVDIHRVRSYRPGDRDATRSLAMMAAALAPGRVWRDVPAGLDLLHYPVTIPIPQPRAPHVVTVHDLQHHDLPEFFGAVERRYRALAYDRSARRARAVVTPSEASRERLVAIGVPAERIEVIPYGVDHSRFQPEPRTEEDVLLDELALPERFLFYPANLWPHKNHGRLIEALARIDDPAAQLVLSGQTYGKLETLMELTAELGVGERVHHIGHVPPAAMAALYRRADGLVFPSLYEGFGSPPLEAMASGCPVAASRSGSLGEVCGDAALSLDPLDVSDIAAAISELLTDRGRREVLRTAGLERAAGFSWQRTAERHVALYERVLGTAAK